ncbi:hypothetical protein AAK899_01960 [Erysipelotrichaceae bacterium 51-3]
MDKSRFLKVKVEARKRIAIFWPEKEKDNADGADGLRKALHPIKGSWRRIMEKENRAALHHGRQRGQNGSAVFENQKWSLSA